MERNSRPESLNSGRPNPRNLLQSLGSISIMTGFSHPEAVRVIETSHRESIEDVARHDLMSARAFEASGLYRPGADTEPELFID